MNKRLSLKYGVLLSPLIVPIEHFAFMQFIAPIVMGYEQNSAMLDFWMTLLVILPAGYVLSNAIILSVLYNLNNSNRLTVGRLVIRTVLIGTLAYVYLTVPLIPASISTGWLRLLMLATVIGATLSASVSYLFALLSGLVLAEGEDI